MSINSTDILQSTRISMEYIQHISIAIDQLKKGDKGTCLLIVRYIEKSILCDLKYSDVAINNVVNTNEIVH